MAIPCYIRVRFFRGAVRVKGKRFRNHRYTGDPTNAMLVFNESAADEPIVFDIGVTTGVRRPKNR